MLSHQEYSALSLSAVVACLVRVDAVANGRDGLDEENFAALSGALFGRDPDNLEALFPNPQHHAEGIAVLKSALAGSREHSGVLRYLISILDLSQRLKKDTSVQARLGSGLDELSNTPFAQQIFGVGELYQQTIGTLGRRIQVSGDPHHLQREQTAAEIRTLLLCAIRFAWLWQQMGGRRWHLLLQRKRLIASLDSLNSRI